jgi:hypothetical protein
MEDMKLISTLLLIAGCAGSQEIDFARDTLGPFDPDENLVVVLHDQVGSGYKLASATYLLDGKQIFHRSSSKGWSDLPDDVRVFKAYASPGWHQLLVLLEYQPNDLGIFTYARGYRLKIRSGTNFTARSHEPTAVHAVISAKGSLTTRLEDRPVVAYHVVQRSDSVARDERAGAGR